MTLMSSENITKVPISASQLLIQPEVVTVFLTLNLLICSNVLAVFGIVGNIMNIVNFSKEGFEDSVNITLSALAVSDIGALVFQICVTILVSPFWSRLDLPFSSSPMFSTQFFYPHEYFIRVSGLITCFATFERCLCVVLPMKVKRIINRNVSITVNVLIFLVLLLYLFPVNYVTYLDWSYDAKVNKTKLNLFYRNSAETVLRISYFITDLFTPYFTFSVLIICNVIIIVKLKSKAKWRQAATGIKQNSGTEISGKERRLVVMLTTVSVIFIACLTPQSVMLTALGIVRELKLNGQHFDVSLTVYSFTYLLETVNCSVNIIVYYKMSSKFRERIRTWVPCLKQEP